MGTLAALYCQKRSFVMMLTVCRSNVHGIRNLYAIW